MTMNGEQLRADFDTWLEGTIYSDDSETFPIDLWNAYQAGQAALLAERDALRESQQWQPIETAPKDGTEVIVYHPEAGVCAAFCPADGFAWHCMDGQNTVVGTKSGRSIPRMTSFISPPTHWMPMPEAPRAALAQGEV